MMGCDAKPLSKRNTGSVTKSDLGFWVISLTTRVMWVRYDIWLLFLCLGVWYLFILLLFIFLSFLFSWLSKNKKSYRYSFFFLGTIFSFKQQENIINKNKTIQRPGDISSKKKRPGDIGPDLRELKRKYTMIEQPRWIYSNLSKQKFTKHRRNPALVVFLKTSK